MVNSTLLQKTNKNKIGEQLVRNNTQIESALKNVVLLMNEVRDIHTNNSTDIEITEACKEIYNTNLQKLSEELSRHTPL